MHTHSVSTCFQPAELLRTQHKTAHYRGGWPCGEKIHMMCGVGVQETQTVSTIISGWTPFIITDIGCWPSQSKPAGSNCWQYSMFTLETIGDLSWELQFVTTPSVFINKSSPRKEWSQVVLVNDPSTILQKTCKRKFKRKITQINFISIITVFLINKATFSALEFLCQKHEAYYHYWVLSGEWMFIYLHEAVCC